eukprot:jgi/Galph1/5956/GphlegSOOS_G4540.1
MDPKTTSGTEQVVTCTSCHVRIESTENIRFHYGSDWHRVNLKRKVAGLEPISFQEFEMRLNMMKKQSEVNDNSKKDVYCHVCKKHFSSSKAYKQHERSRRHLVQLEQKPEFTEKNEQVKERTFQCSNDGAIELDAISPGTCLFDGRSFNNIIDCLKHMEVAHGFHIPFWERIVDLQGLLVYLGSKVGQYTTCVFCDKEFLSLTSVRHHMASKSHCRMKDDDYTWKEEFYTFYNFDEDSFGEVTSFSDSALDSEAAPYEEAFELCLPRYRVGHRAFALYYRQRPRLRRSQYPMLEEGTVSLEWKEKQNNMSFSKIIPKSALDELKKGDLAIGQKTNYTAKLQKKRHISSLNSGY